jgi:hypothetical protein
VFHDRSMCCTKTRNRYKSVPRLEHFLFGWFTVVAQSVTEFPVQDRLLPISVQASTKSTSSGDNPGGGIVSLLADLVYYLQMFDFYSTYAKSPSMEASNL